MDNGILKHISKESQYFIGKKSNLKRYLVCSMQGCFPVAIKTGPNSIAVIFRTGGAHVGVSGTIAVSFSYDGGKSWSDPQEVAPRWDDSRNPAFGINNKGELIAAYVKARYYLYKEDNITGPVYSKQSLEENARSARQNPVYVIKSKDEGKTWEKRESFISKHLSLHSTYGRIIQIPDGTLLMPVYGIPYGKFGVGSVSILVRSYDGGDTWGDESIVTHDHHETSYAFLDDDTLVAAARSDQGFVSTLFSSDLGRTWSEPVQVTLINEHPADIIQLESGNVLLTFGRRVHPMGCGALISSDRGKTWNRDREILLSGDGKGDLGYPSTVQLADGNIVAVMYYASGSAMSHDVVGCGEVSSQAIHFREEDLV